MLRTINNKRCSALILFGDYYDLRELHDLVHYFVGKSNLGSHLNEFLLAFAYDIRKAYEGRREQKEFGLDSLDRVTYRGVALYWPYYLIYIKLLRQCASHVNTLRWHQSVLYNLEALVEQSLLEVDSKITDKIMWWLDHSIGFDREYLPEWFRVCLRFYLEGPRGKKRLLRLVEVIQRLSPLSTEYRSFYTVMKESSLTRNCSIFALEDTTPWPDGEDIEES